MQGSTRIHSGPPSAPARKQAGKPGRKLPIAAGALALVAAAVVAPQVAGADTAPGCQMTGGSQATPFTDTSTGKMDLAEYTLNSDTTRTEHLVVRDTMRQTFFFTESAVTSAQCSYDTRFPLPEGQQFNYLYADGTGTYGPGLFNQAPGYSFRVEIHLPNAAGQTTITLLVRNSSGTLVKRVSGPFVLPGSESDY